MRLGAIMTIAAVVAAALYAQSGEAGSLEPTNAPGPTMHTLEDIYQKLEALGRSEGLVLHRNMTLSPTSLDFGTITAGETSTINVSAYNYGDFTLTLSGCQSSHPAFTGTAAGRVLPDRGLGVSITYAPATTGVHTGIVTVIGDNTSGSNQVPCTGRCMDPPRFVDNGDGTVTDKATTLMWTKNANHGVMAWSDAMVYCEELTWAGYDDWRLPSAKLWDCQSSDPEIDTLGRPGGIPAAEPYTIPAQPFTNLYQGYYQIRNYDCSGSKHYYHIGGFAVGSSPAPPSAVWPVRGGD